MEFLPQHYLPVLSFVNGTAMNSQSKNQIFSITLESLPVTTR